MNIGQAILSTLLLIVILSLVTIWAMIFPDLEIFSNIAFAVLIDSLIMLLLIFFFVRKFRVKDRPMLAPTPWYWYLIAICAGVIFVFTQGPLRIIFDSIISIEPATTSTVGTLFNYQFPTYFYYIKFLSFAVIGPISEELFFREFQQQYLHKKYTPILVIIVNALLFGMIHLPIMEWGLGHSNDMGRQAFMAFFGALGLGYIYYKSKSVGPAIAMHMAWNATALLL
ncbi:MAG TPA: hypothetical protein DCS93_12100 [Microscillaceae bacterium]|nr:hypothetical protein [Microscillaceae bacterium]